MYGHPAMTPTMPKPIQIFRPGRHQAMSGQSLEFSDSDIEASAAAYDPALHEAPLVIGHPRHNAPAYGWVGALSVTGGALQATPDQLDPAFAEMVREGRFKKVSASFYAPDSPSNPKPGVYYLRHVGFLGALPPAVKGLKPVEFAAADEGVVTVEFSERERWGFHSIAQLLRRLREKWIEKDGVEATDSVLPSYLIDDIQRAAEADDDPATDPRPAYSEPATHQEGDMTPEELARREAELAERERQLQTQTAEFSEREQQLSAREAERRRAGITEFAEGLVSAGRLLPRDRDGVVELLAALPAGQELAFGEGDARFEGSAETWLREFLQRLPEQVDFAERSAPGAEGDGETVNFAAPPGYTVDAAAMDTHRRAMAYQRQHKVSYDEAVDAVRTSR